MAPSLCTCSELPGAGGRGVNHPRDFPVIGPEAVSWGGGRFLSEAATRSLGLRRGPAGSFLRPERLLRGSATHMPTAGTAHLTPRCQLPVGPLWTNLPCAQARQGGCQCAGPRPPLQSCAWALSIVRVLALSGEILELFLKETDTGGVGTRLRGGCLRGPWLAVSRGHLHSRCFPAFCRVCSCWGPAQGTQKGQGPGVRQDTEGAMGQ